MAAGTISWIWAWIFLVLCVANLVFNSLVLPREVIEERGKPKKDAKKWDKILTSANIIPTVSMYVCSGLDHRFQWSGNVHVAVHIIGLIFTFSGSMLFTWAMVSNKFFSTLVRLQIDRRHSVATGGPYKLVRHPGYVGYILMAISTPIALGTLWAMVFSGITCLLLIVRTVLEDNTLKRELEGYSAYAEKVRYLLIPSLW